MISQASPRGFRSAGVDFALISGSFVLVELLTRDLAPAGWGVIVGAGFAIAACLVGVMALLQDYKTSPRYFGFVDVLQLLKVGVAAALLRFALPFLIGAPRGGSTFFAAPLLFGLLSLVLLASIRVGQRLNQSTLGIARTNGGRRTLIVGAGDAGETIVLELKRSKNANSIPIGFLDDSPTKRNLVVHGVPVLGSISELPVIVAREGVDEIILAMPSVGGDRMRQIHELCQAQGVPVRTLPSAAELVSNFHHLPHRLRDVEIEDLLRRETVKDEDLSAAKSYVKGARVLITGGGGSIGSELARQVAKLEPLELVLLGKGENSVFEASQDLLRRDYEAKSVVADIRDRAALETIFETYRPTVVFHAAAHKHVPLMEHNPIEAVKNNVLGTKNVAELAARFGVKKFVQISTDKAVNPTNVMGATKRVAEMIVRSMAQRAETEFAIVRFGNVLGSRGSLVPTLKKQIKDGGPVTLTDARMTRYFMTIPEAVHLILQAGAIGKTGDVFILDMGEPIKIYDLAKELIRLYGLVPDEDMKIEFIGARPGEKLHEELSYATESLEATEYAKIRRIAPTMIDETWLDSEVAWLIDLCAQRDQGQVRGRLMQLATEDGASPLKYAVIDEPSVESPTDRV